MTTDGDSSPSSSSEERLGDRRARADDDGARRRAREGAVRRRVRATLPEQRHARASGVHLAARAGAAVEFCRNPIRRRRQDGPRPASVDRPRERVRCPTAEKLYGVGYKPRPGGAYLPTEGPRSVAAKVQRRLDEPDDSPGDDHGTPAPLPADPVRVRCRRRPCRGRRGCAGWWLGVWFWCSWWWCWGRPTVLGMGSSTGVTGALFVREPTRTLCLGEVAASDPRSDEWLVQLSVDGAAGAAGLPVVTICRRVAWMVTIQNYLLLWTWSTWFRPACAGLPGCCWRRGMAGGGGCCSRESLIGATVFLVSATAASSGDVGGVGGRRRGSVR